MTLLQTIGYIGLAYAAMKAYHVYQSYKSYQAPLKSVPIDFHERYGDLLPPGSTRPSYPQPRITTLPLPPSMFNRPTHPNMFM